MCVCVVHVSRSGYNTTVGAASSMQKYWALTELPNLRVRGGGDIRTKDVPGAGNI